MRTIRIATRGSALAMKQTQAVGEGIAAQGAAVEIVRIATLGDRAADRSIAAIGGDGVFVKELEAALLDGRADLAVHSLKDMPTEENRELRVAAVLEREDARDVLISRGNAYDGLRSLPPGAIVGTSSLRRQAMLLLVRPDAKPRDMRGNVDSRVRKVMEGKYDAAVLALEGLKRLGLLEAVEGGSPLALDEMTPAAGQGAIAVQSRADDTEATAIVAPLHHRDSALATAMERAVLRVLGGGCLVPIGVHATVLGGSYALTGVIAAANGTACVRKSATGVAASEVEALRAAEQMANEMLQAGGDALVQAFRTSTARL